MLRKGQVFGFKRLDRFCSNSSKKRRIEKKYSGTLNLPNGIFPMRHSRKIELDLEQNVSFDSLFGKKKSSSKFILHDGPPYANGDAHFGHAINRILKDIVVKRKILQGYQVDYRPGWDCHGLPIELKAFNSKTNGQSVESFTADHIRNNARNLANYAIKRQQQAFSQWFLSADWDGLYRTFDSDYSIQELKVFYSLYKRGLIFRDWMPVFFSPSTRTALAEAELQYRDDHISLSAFIKYPLPKFDDDCHALIWTTTPWTLLANEAIAYSRQLNYCVVSIGSNKFLVAQEMIPLLIEKFKCPVSFEYSIENLNKLDYLDFLSGHIRPFIPSNHVTASKGLKHFLNILKLRFQLMVSIEKKGTGLVHIAPNHGHEDFKLMQNYRGKNSEQVSIVNDDGFLQVSSFKPISIIENNEASRFVLEKMVPHKFVFHTEQIEHSFPYDWRSNKPVLIRPSNQWFLEMNPIRAQCLQELEKINFYPSDRLRKEMVHHLTTRPNWCLSRQRKWGVPIPMFFSCDDVEKKPFINDEIFKAVLKKFKTKGLDVWWQESPEQLLAEVPKIEAKNLVKGQDILDIWFDSGCSWASVLSDQSPQVADLYLEGVDQIRGWFQSSLIISVALQGCAPYRSIFIHGFALDKNGKKMSKSLGNIIDPIEIISDPDQSQLSQSKKTEVISGCGCDGLRLWIARHAATHNDVHVDVNEFRSEMTIIVNRFRNTLRFLLAYLAKYCDDKHLVGCEQYHRMKVLDKYLLFSLLHFHFKSNRLFEQYRFGDLIELFIHQINVLLSNFYFSRIKHRLYCDRVESFDVRSILTVMHHFYHTTAYHLAPVMPHIFMETDCFVPLRRDAIFEPCDDLQGFVEKYLFLSNDDGQPFEFEQNFALIHSLIETLNIWAHSKYRLSEYHCHLVVKQDSAKVWRAIKMFQQSQLMSGESELAECLQVASVSYSDNCIGHDSAIAIGHHSLVCPIKWSKGSLDPPNDDKTEDEKSSQDVVQVVLFPTPNRLCARCRRYSIKPNQEERVDVCDRCLDAL